MASSVLFRLLILLGLLSISATARPCKTFLISTYSISFNPDVTRNPNPNPNDPSSSSSTEFVTVFTEIRQFRPYRRVHPAELIFHRGAFPVVEEDHIQRPQRPLIPVAYDFSSLRDRTKDILSVVVALLFGVGCGALTAATMYLVWTLFANRYHYRTSFDQLNEEQSDEDDASPKKMGYVKIPAAAPVDSVPAPAKEVA